MKRIFITIAFFMLSAGLFAGEAWNNHLGFGWRLPTKLTLHSETKGKILSPELRLPLRCNDDPYK